MILLVSGSLRGAIEAADAVVFCTLPIQRQQVGDDGLIGDDNVRRQIEQVLAHLRARTGPLS